ncbi:hypothetical protein PHYSODRAFT_506712, partial [Phytophthora sojae]
LLGEMGFPQKEPEQVWCDTIRIAKNPGNHKTNKHIEIRYLLTWLNSVASRLPTVRQQI